MQVSRHPGRLLVFLVGAIAVTPLHAEADLSHTTFERFKDRISGVVVATVLSVEQLKNPVFFPEEVGDTAISFVAKMRIDEIICGSAGLEPGKILNFYFSAEVHSAHPTVGERAVVFPSKVQGGFVESAYGRSYWPIIEIHHEDGVHWTWENRFMKQLVPPGQGYLSLADIRRVFACDH